MHWPLDRKQSLTGLNKSETVNRNLKTIFGNILRTGDTSQTRKCDNFYSNEWKKNLFLDFNISLLCWETSKPKICQPPPKQIFHWIQIIDGFFFFGQRIPSKAFIISLSNYWISITIFWSWRKSDAMCYLLFCW